MKLTRKSDYALRALLTLVEHRGRGPISVRAIAEANDIPKRFLEQIMLELKAHGFVRSVAGRDGGFVLGRPPELITMGQVVRHFDGVLAPIGCVSTSDYEQCSQESVCRFRHVLLDIRNYVTHRMDSANLQELAAGPIVTLSEVFKPEFIHGDGI